MESVSSLRSTSSAVGPSITFPNTVGAISTPFVTFVGTASTMCRTSGRASLSNTISSPRRGVTVKPSCPSIRSSSSERSPAAFTSRPAVSSPPGSVSRKPPSSSRATDSTGVERRRSQPDSTASVANASGVVNGHTSPSRGHLDRSVRAGAEVRLAPRTARRRPPCAGRCCRSPARASRMAGNSAACSSFHATSSAPVRSTGIPTRAAYSLEQLVAARHEPRLERPGLRVEPGVEQRRVRLARAGAHVRAGLEQRHAQVEPAQLAGDRAADDARADDRHIRIGRVPHPPSIATSAGSALEVPGQRVGLAPERVPAVHRHLTRRDRVGPLGVDVVGSGEERAACRQLPELASRSAGHA